MNPGEVTPNNDWILEVLSDIKEFAQQHDLPLLGKQLSQVATIAEAEISSETVLPQPIGSQI